MINFTNNRNSVSIEFIDNPRYLNAGTIEVPLNSLALEFDGSGLALFKKAANGDVLFQCFPSETNLATREAIETFYQSYMVSAAGGGGSGTGAVDSVNGKTGVVVLSATDVGAVAKTDFDSYSATVQTALDSKADESDIPSLEGYLTKDSADTLYATAGSLDSLTAKDTELEGEIDANKSAFDSYTATTNSAIAGKQDTLVSGTNIKTINGQTLLGEGNIEIQGGGTSYTAGEGINISDSNEISVDKEALDIPTLQTGASGSSTNYVWSLGEYSNNSWKNVVSTVTLDNIYGGQLWVMLKVWGDSIYRNIKRVPTASSRADGVMSSEDKAKLDSIPDGSTIALKSEIPSLEGYLTKSSADTVYQPIGDYVTGEEMSAYTYDKATIDGKISGGGTFDPTNYYNKTDVNGLLDDKVDTTAFTQYTGSVQTTLEGKLDTTAFTQYSGSVQTTLESKADADDVYTKAEVYTKTEVYSKGEIDTKIGDIESLLAAI